MAFNPFQYDWNEPFRRAAAQPPRTGLTLADLWAPSPRPQYPEAPKPYGSYSDLGPDAKKSLRREAILRAAMALGGDPGRIGSNLAQAAASVGDWKDEQLEEARHRQQQDYALAARQAEFDADREKFDREDVRRKTEAQGALQAVQAVIDAEPEWGARAEAAAKAGDFDALDKMLAEAEKRRQIRASGGDPNDPLWEERRKKELENEYKLKLEEEEKKRGIDQYYEKPPMSLEEIEKRAAAAARGQHSVWGNRGGGGSGSGPGGEGGVPRLLEHGDVPYQYTYDPETGTYTGKKVPGAPTPSPNWIKIEDPGKNETFFYDPDTGATKPAPQGVSRTFDMLEERHKRALTNEEKAVVEKQWRQGATPMLQRETIGFVEQNLGRRLSAKERNEVAAKWKQGVRAGVIVQQMKRPKPPAPGAPTQGNVRSPAPQRQQSAIPPPLRREPVTDRDKQDLRAEVDARFASLSPEEREKKYQQALRLLEQGA